MLLFWTRKLSAAIRTLGLIGFGFAVGRSISLVCPVPRLVAGFRQPLSRVSVSIGGPLLKRLQAMKLSCGSLQFPPVLVSVDHLSFKPVFLTH
jgi:hypothetical protein